MDHTIFNIETLLKYFEASKTTVNANNMTWKSIGLSEESVEPTATSDNSLSKLDFLNNPKFCVETKGSFLKADRVSFFRYDKITITYFAFEVKSWPFCTYNCYNV